MKYKKKDKLYDAIQWTGRNLLDVWDFCDRITLKKRRGFNVEDTIVEIKVETMITHEDHLGIGYYLVKRIEDNSFLIYTEDEFKDSFYAVDDSGCFEGVGLA